MRASVRNGPILDPRTVEPREPSALGHVVPGLLLVSWVGAFLPEPQVLATIPGVFGLLWLGERCRTWFSFVLWSGFYGGIGLGLGYRWLPRTIQDFGGLSAPAGYGAAALFAVAGLVHAWIGAAFYRGMMMRGRRPHPVTVAALMAVCEALPVRLFPWSAGHGAVNVPPLLQLAEWGGVPLVSFTLYLFAASLWEAARAALPGRGPEGIPKRALAAFVVGAVLLGVGAWRYSVVRKEEDGATQRIRVSIVQANVGSQRKRDATEKFGEAQRQSAEAYRRGSDRAVAEGAELIVFPETAITGAVPFGTAEQPNNFLPRSQVGFGFLNELGKDRAFLVGLYEDASMSEPLGVGKAKDVRYNAAGLRQPGDRTAKWTKYRKVYLIPFGETVPFKFLRDRLPQSFEMIAGAEDQKPLEFRGLKIVPFLCYEGILPDHVRRIAGEKHADLLASLTNDSWFPEPEPAQHLNLTRFRSVEHRTPMVRATNTGISAFVSATGDVTSRLDVGVEGVLTHDVPLVPREPTLYVRFGHRLPWAFGIWALLAWLGALMRPRAAPR